MSILLQNYEEVKEFVEQILNASSVDDKINVLLKIEYTEEGDLELLQNTVNKLSAEQFDILFKGLVEFLSKCMNLL